MTHFLAVIIAFSSSISFAQVGDDPLMRTKLTIVSFDEQKIVAKTIENKKITLKRSAIKKPVVDGKPHEYDIILADWTQAISK